MRLQTSDFQFSLLTPCFSGTAAGKEADHSELRVPPIRGHIRFWHRAAFDPASANRVWGSTTGDEGEGSRVAIRIIARMAPSRSWAPLLPHKTQGQGKRAALPVAAAAAIQLQRLPACTNEDWERARSATRLWLVAGTLGYRASRAAGSVWPVEPWTPRTRDELIAQLAPLLRKPAKPWAAALVGETVEASWELLRQAASNTPRGPAGVFGNAQPRQPSPTRFKVVSLTGGACLLAIAPSLDILRRASQEIESKSDRRFWDPLGVWDFLGG